MKNWPRDMYTDFRRLKTAKIEGGAYIAPLQAKSSTLFGRLYRVKVFLFTEEIRILNLILRFMDVLIDVCRL